MAEVIKLEKIDKIYRGAGDTQVLFGIDLSFDEGSFNAIVGESGSGKSTLMNIIGTLDVPSSGKVYINNTRTDVLSHDKLAELRNQTIGFVFQFHYLLPEFTALENVLIPCLIEHGRADKHIRERADELFELAGISKIRNNLAPNMSGGQQQRTAIIRALINDPRIILADEPTGNLDTSTTASIYTLFRQINQAYKTTFVIVTHDRKIAEQTDRIVEIKDGRIEMDVRK